MLFFGNDTFAERLQRTERDVLRRSGDRKNRFFHPRRRQAPADDACVRRRADQTRDTETPMP